MSAESALRVTFPPSYRHFLRKYGSGSFGGMEISGLGSPAVSAPSVVWETIWHRDHDVDFPVDFVMVHDPGGEDISCIDTQPTSEEGEAAVVVWVRGTPLKDQALEQIAPDFGAFLLEYIRREIAWRESKEQQEGWIAEARLHAANFVTSCQGDEACIEGELRKRERVVAQLLAANQASLMAPGTNARIYQDAYMGVLRDALDKIRGQERRKS